MTVSKSNHDERVPDVAQVEEACARFTAAWGNGAKPELKDFLLNMTLETQRYALCELLWIEWDQLRRLGTPAQLADYQVRFADLSDVVDEAWRSDFGRLATQSQTRKTRGGRYTIVKPHARGGIGQVYVAKDDELERQVALKEIQFRHTHSVNVCERFVREAKITGKLEHPGIVPVYSFGTNEDGSPYYVTRFIHGDSLEAAISRFHGEYQTAGATSQKPAKASADDVLRRPSGARTGTGGLQKENPSQPPTSSGVRRPSHAGSTRRDAYRSRAFRQLLARFVHVCHVMEYAHSHGVLHRDLKPANIMLGKHGETLVVDWGLAKQEGEPEPALPRETVISDRTRTSFTTHGALIGTVAYMSPEQAAGKLDQLTAASDLYSLGATLYHILVGQPPLSGESEEQALASIQTGKIPRAKSVQPSVPQPLDAICANAMSMDPASRYESAIALAEDLEHWLADEAVSAYVEPWTSRAARWGRRHQTLMTSGLISAVVLAIAAVAIATIIGVNNHHLSAARSDADTKRIAADNARQVAESERDMEKAIAEFMVKCFRSPDPDADGKSVTVAELLDQSFDDLKTDSRIKPETKVRLLEALAESNIGLGLYSRAIEIGEFANTYCQRHEIQKKELVNDVTDALAHARLNDGQIAIAVKAFEDLLKQGVPTDPSRALSIEGGLASGYYAQKQFEKALNVAQSALSRAAEAEDLDDTETIPLEHLVAVIELELGHIDNAINLFSHMFERGKRELGPLNVATLMSMNALGDAYCIAGRFTDAIALHKSGIELRQSKFGDDHPYTLNARNNLANALRDSGDITNAIALHENIWERRQKVLGETHPATLTSINNLALCYSRVGRTDESIKLLEQLLQFRCARLGNEHPSTIAAARNLASEMMRVGFSQQVIPLLEQQYKTLNGLFGPTHPDCLQCRTLLAQAYRRIGRNVEAVEIYLELLPKLVDQLSADNPEVLRVQVNLATALAMSDRVDQAIVYYEKTIRQQIQVIGENHPDTIHTRVSLATCCHNFGHSEKAIPILEGLTATIVDTIGWKSPLTIQSHLVLGKAYHRCDRPSEAIAIFDLVTENLRKHFGDSHLQTLIAERYAASVLLESGKADEAIARFGKALETLRASVGNNNTETITTMGELAAALKQTHQFRQAESLFKELIEYDRSQKRDRRSMAEHLFEIGTCQLKQGNYTDATTSLNESYLIQQHDMPEHWNTLLIESSLAVALAGSGQVEEGRRHALNAFEMMQRVRDTLPDDKHMSIVDETINSVAQSYELSGSPELAHQWRQKVSAFMK